MAIIDPAVLAENLRRVTESYAEQLHEQMAQLVEVLTGSQPRDPGAALAAARERAAADDYPPTAFGEWLRCEDARLIESAIRADMLRRMGIEP